MSLLETCQKSLLKNNFNCEIAENVVEASTFIKNIIMDIKPQTVSYGDSETLKSTGILEYCKTCSDFTFIDTFNPDESFKEQIVRKKEALTVDLFLTGTNAVTLDGILVNLDMIGNRIGGITFGPKKVILTVSLNKIVQDLDAAFKKVREYTAPKNAARHPDLKTPCITMNKCMNCSSPRRICNSWSIIEKSYPKGRITVIIIKDELGI